MQRQLALRAALSRQLNKDVIKRLFPELGDAPLQFDWLIKRPFVQRRGSLWTYHPVVRDLMLRYLRQDSQEEWEALHLKLADYYQQRAESLGISDKDAQLQNKTWQMFTQEKCYHKLSANFKREIPESIRNFVATYRLNGFNNALPWIGIIKQCGEIGDDPYWGNILQTGMDNLRSLKWKDAIEMVSKINHAKLLIDQVDQSFLYWVEGLLNSFSSNDIEAIECFQKAVEIKSNNDSAWYNMGVAYGQLGNQEKAIECFQKAIEFKPEGDSAWNILGWVFLKLGKLEKAENALLYAWKCSNHKNEQSSMNLGHVYHLLKNQKEAMAWYKTSLALWESKEAFFQGMKMDFSDLDMKKYGISQQDFDAILAILKR